jgi:hypothetical protein
MLPDGFNNAYCDNAFQWIISTNGNNTATLTNALNDPSCGNFYWMGHGGPQSIGPVTNAGLTRLDISRLLGNRGYLGPNTFYNNHAFRLVILDGCNTSSWDWAKAWGIPFFEEQSEAVYAAEGLDYCAFVGWTNKTDQVETTAGGDAYGMCLNALFYYWYNRYPLKQCLNAYNIQLTNNGNGTYLHHFNEWKIVGCADLRSSDR